MLEINPIQGRTIVMLKVAVGEADAASSKLNLAAILTRQAGEPTSYRYAPDSCLLASETLSADEIIGRCNSSLAGMLYNAVDYSAGLRGLTLHGPGVRDVLASGCGLDLRPAKFMDNSCYRTRLAGIAAIIVAIEEHEFELFVDRSFERYMSDWLQDTSNIIALEAAG